MADGRIPVGVLGNSDSHSYHDSLMLGDPGLRGGPYRATTFQWTEIWARLRPDEVDLGDWGRWGTSGRRATLLRVVGLLRRSPRKEDYRFNFAVSGASCGALTHRGWGQARALVREMRRDPERWRRGVVVIRLGINSLGTVPELDSYAAGGLTAEALDRVQACAQDFETALRLIRAEHRDTRVVLVGVLNNADWARNLDRWRDPQALRNITVVLDEFDRRLRDLVDRDGAAAFLDDRAWFRRLWGGRAPDGQPAYRTVELEGGIGITNTSGDDPRNAVLADGHFGSLANGLWLNELISLIESNWRLGLTGIASSELLRLASPNGTMEGGAHSAATGDSR